MKNRNLPRHLRRQLPSAEANFEGCYTDLLLQNSSTFVHMQTIIASSHMTCD